LIKELSRKVPPRERDHTWYRWKR